MTLFGDHAESNLQRATSLVEQTIEAPGVDPAQTRLGAGAQQWALRRGSASILISVQPPARGADEGTIRLVAPVVRIPGGDAAAGLFRKLLELNTEVLVGVAFGVQGSDVVLVAERSLQDLDASEVDGMVRTIGAMADRYDDQLASEFGTVRSSDS